MAKMKNILANKNSKFLFYHFNDYLKQINEPTKSVFHTLVTDDKTALEILQSKNWQYFIEIILEVCQLNNGGELTQLVRAKEIKIIKNSVENLTICKSLYANFYYQIASNLSDALRNLPPNELDKIDKDLRLNDFFIDSDNGNNQEEIMSAYSYFYHVLGRFSGKLDLIIIPKPDTPAFIKTDKIISANQLYEKFRCTDGKGLVSVQVLAGLNIHLGGAIELSRKTMTEFLHNMSMQALNRENDNILLDFENVTNLVTSIIVLLKQQNKKSIQINDSNKVEVDKEISSNYQFNFDLDPMERIKEDINNMIKNNERPEMPELFVLPFPLTTEEIKEQTKQEGEDFIQTSLTLREEELRAADETADEENKDIIKSIVNPTPGLLVDNKIDFQVINFSPTTTDNTYKLPPAVQKQLAEMVIDAAQPKIEQDLYIEDDLDSFMFVDEPKNDNDSMVIDVKLRNEQIKRNDDDNDDETKKSTYSF